MTKLKIQALFSEGRKTIKGKINTEEFRQDPEKREGSAKRMAGDSSPVKWGSNFNRDIKASRRKSAAIKEVTTVGSGSVLAALKQTTYHGRESP
ncbi:hypothetical protein EVAR_2343_1 [Eumeta japonica]|uniref:Uncharacterized protein n=1 Tax=Eumeta variegata TaxID=151549 RepID=A0A4C1SFZ1_EUMVA|nr:hypothetical protein EVAR_2343_1 [Eumeta japonica]